MSREYLYSRRGSGTTILPGMLGLHIAARRASETTRPSQEQFLNNAAGDNVFETFLDESDNYVVVEALELNEASDDAESLSIDTQMEIFEEKTGKIIDAQLRKLKGQQIRYDRHRSIDRSHFMNGYQFADEVAKK